MAGYANRLLTRTYPELTEAGAPVIHVVMRNPRLVPPDELTRREIRLGPDGQPDTKDALDATYEILARLITGWLAYDATATGDDQPRLPLPATAESVAKLPSEILTDLAETLSTANPQKRTEPPADGTSRTS